MMKCGLADRPVSVMAPYLRSHCWLKVPVRSTYKYVSGIILKGHFKLLVFVTGRLMTVRGGGEELRLLVGIWIREGEMDSHLCSFGKFGF